MVSKLALQGPILGQTYVKGGSDTPIDFVLGNPGSQEPCGLPTVAPLELFARSQVRNF